ncbi:unnamed protein product [Peronospora belbahrii]|uniref:5-formyltetrahydrofolate cyclo-ligase n=1 Tax=Peronospora belbahrii TaxID=622444 RepID=A0AAU9KR03_9STRA|nr:unnamed protein product [Peronospora belbahrii]
MGQSAEDLKMLQTHSIEEIQSFPKDKWQIPNPSLHTDSGVLRDDAILGGRLGHGKGYYDSFLHRLTKHYDNIGHARPITIGLCLAPQLVEKVPLAAHDQMLDLIVTPHEFTYWQQGEMKRRSFLSVLCLLLCASIAHGQNLYEVLGVSSSATLSQIKRVYRKMPHKYYSEKQTEKIHEAMKEEFVKITNAYRVLSNSERRKKYDVYGTTGDDQDFQNFHEAVQFASDDVDESLLSWIGLVIVLPVGIISIVVMQRNRTKPLTKRREALQSLSKSTLTKKGDLSFTKTINKMRKQYIDDPLRAHQD